VDIISVEKKYSDDAVYSTKGPAAKMIKIPGKTTKNIPAEIQKIHLIKKFWGHFFSILIYLQSKLYI